MTIKSKTPCYLRACFVFALLLLSNLRLLAYPIPEIVAKAKPAVVEIVAIDEKGSSNPLGTGFFISPMAKLSQTSMWSKARLR